jgi:hypothetical protein
MSNQTWHGVYAPEWDSRLLMPVIRPRFRNYPLTHAMQGQSIIREIANLNGARIVERLTAPMIVLRFILPVNLRIIRQVESLGYRLNWSRAYTLSNGWKGST